METAETTACPGCRDRDARIAALEAGNAELKTRLAALETEVRDLRVQVHRNSSNSSRPPSTDPPGASRPKKEPTGRKPGGQPGHEGKSRPLRPAEQVDEIQEVFPKECENCLSPFPPDARPQDVPPVRHQYAEIPPVVARLIEVRLHALTCPGCGHLTRAGLPPQVPAGAVGPRLQAMAVYLAGRLRVSCRDTEDALVDLFGEKGEVALGTVADLRERTSEALATPCEEALQVAQAQPAKHSDETSWRLGAKRAWLWILVTPFLAVFRIDRSRSRAAFMRLIGKIQGVLVSDRYSAYRNWPLGKWQVCWAHLKRDWQGLVDRGGSAAEIGRACLEIVDRMFGAWHRFQAGRLDRAALQRELQPVQQELEGILAMGSEDADPKAAGLSKELLKVWPALWTFTRVDGVPPTNNDAERPLRPAVLWRKGSYGSHSENGARFAERILTVVQTLRRQGRNVLDYLEQAIRAHRLGQPAPSLVPEALRGATPAHAA